MKVELRNLTKVFPARDKRSGEPVVAVDHFNFTIPDGELIGLLGPSGCGKSTTLYMICGLLEPSEGQIFFGEDDVTDLPPEERGVGLVFQNYALYPHLTVRQNILFPLQNFKGADKLSKEEMSARTEAAARLVQIESLLDRKPAELSGGQQQRVAIARALINNPRVLLLDEPLGALDLKLRKQMQIELKRLQKKLGITFVYVTHDQEEAMTMSDRIAVMRDGVILQMDAPMKIYDRPNCRFVADFIGESNVISGVVRSVAGENLSVETPDGMIQACGEGFTVDERICVSVRSEYLNLSTTPVEGFTLRGKVKDFIYVGTVIKTAVELKGDREIKQSRFELDGTLREGVDVYAWWEPHRGVAIHDASEAEVQS